ncbi:universal stress protein [Aquabacterium humicola]|uniref:universal stress protein n=1 Tax=Aquabacterium humicola TaxID=3237377 RepID=UPI002542AC3F|nr:universal stress protein [Rubrivivax pictus]
MPNLHSILLVTDLGDDALPALQRAVQLASEQQAGLTVLTAPAAGPVHPWRTGRDAFGAGEFALQRTRRLLRRLSREVSDPCELRLMAGGGEADALMRIGEAAGRADLLVLAAGRANPLRAWLLGSPAERVLRIAARPVLVVKQAPPLPGAPYRRALVPVDLDDGALPALRLAARVAPDAALHLLHAMNESLPSPLRLAGTPADVLQAARNRHRAACLHRLWGLAASLPRQRVFATVGDGRAGWLTLQKAQQVAADLVVVGRQGRSRLGEFLLGSTARTLLAEVPADVLVLPRAPRARAGMPIATATVRPM